MKIELSGHHIDIDEQARQTVKNKFAKIESHFPDIDHLTIIITAEPSVYTVEVSTHYRGAPISVKGRNRELYIAIKNAEKKLESSLSHRKGALGQMSYDKVAESA